MQVIHPCCAGLDVHQKTVVATIMLTQADGSVQKEQHTFLTMTPDLLALDDWLEKHQVTVVALESTGVYWRPVFNILEPARTIILVNARHMKAVPGRKTDMKDSEWIADLLRHGLLQASFIPPQPIREVRELTRYRKTLVQERADEINRLQKVLETANVKLASVATDVLGKSGRHMLTALAEGEQDPAALADLARGRLRAKLPQLRQALDGRVHDHHRILITRILAHIDFLEGSLHTLEREIEERLRPFEEAVDLLRSIPVLQETAIHTIVSELGTEMDRFPSDKHLASWAGVCPGNYESAGKRMSGKTTHGNAYLRAVLCEVAWVIAYTKGTYLSAYYHRIAHRRGKKRAILAVAHKLLIIIYQVLKTKKPYTDLGEDYFEQIDSARIQRRAIQRLEQLGYDVTLTPKQMAS
jgi:transposase